MERAALVLLSALACTLLHQRAAVAESRPLARIPAGTRFDREPPEGWSHLVLFVEGRLASGDLSAASDSVRKYSKMFNLVILSNVTKGDEGSHALDKVAIGFSMKINGLNTVITTDTHGELGANLGLIGRSVFSANEAALDDIRLVARYSNSVLFDAPTMMLYDGDHHLMMVRYLLWVSRSTGRLSTFVWLMDRNPNSGDYRVMEPTFQLLPENMREDRVMNVMGDRFTFGIPAKDAFALVRIPQGRAIPFTSRLQSVAGLSSFDAEKFRELLEAIGEAVEKKPARTDS